MKRSPLYLLAAILIALVVMGCSSNYSTSGLPLLPPMERYDDPEAQTADLMCPLAFQLNFNGIALGYPEPSGDMVQDAVNGVGFSPYASDWYPLYTPSMLSTRGPAPMPGVTGKPVVEQSMIMAGNLVRNIMAQKAPINRTPESGSYNFEGENGFTWTGSYTIDDSDDAAAVGLNLNGVRGDETITITIGGQMQVDGADITLDGTFKLTGDLLVTEDREIAGDTPLKFTVVANVDASAKMYDLAEAQSRISLPYFDGLESFDVSLGVNAGVVLGDTSILSAILQLDLTGDFGYTFGMTASITGQQALVAEDGYWVKVLEDVDFALGSMDTNVTGSVSLEASDGFTANFNLGTMAGKVYADGTLIATIYPDPMYGDLVVDFLDPEMMDQYWYWPWSMNSYNN